jgi:SAM-dependent methyltransferase
VTDTEDGAGRAERHWFEELADHMGPAYLRYSFTLGTVQEVDALVDALGLSPGDLVLDVGCGPGRHVLELARRGIRSLGVDVSERFVQVGRELASAAGLDHLVRFTRLDARTLTGAVRSGELWDTSEPSGSGPPDGFEGFDAAVSLCQGAFGLGGPSRADDPQNLAPDAAVLSGMSAALRPGAPLAVSAFSSYFQVRFLEGGDAFDAAGAVNHERTEVRDPDGLSVPADLWTTCYTPRELRLLAERVGLVVDDVWSVSPGRYAPQPPTVDSHEFLLLAHRPARSPAPPDLPDPAFPRPSGLG